LGGKGSGGRRIGAGRKRKSKVEQAVTGHPGHRGVVLQHPSAGSVPLVAPIAVFDPPADWQALAPEIAKLIADLAFLRGAAVSGEDENPQILELQLRLEEVQGRAQALIVWQEIAPHAFEARTLTPATAAAFVMLCRAIVHERKLSASPLAIGGANHRGLMHRVSTWLKDFAIAPFGKPLYAEQPTAIANPLDRFTKGRA
jgi:hypothetical protein